MTPNPKPVLTAVCNVCGLPWSDHEQMARTWADEDEYGGERKEPITVEFCVFLLKNQNQGPPGPPGPMGMTGMSAP